MTIKFLKWKIYLSIISITLLLIITNILIMPNKNVDKNYLFTFGLYSQLLNPTIILFFIPVMSFFEARDYIYKNYRNKYYEELKNSNKRFFISLRDAMNSILFIIGFLLSILIINYLLSVIVTNQYLNLLIYSSFVVFASILSILIFFPIFVVLIYIFRRKRFNYIFILIIPLFLLVNISVYQFRKINSKTNDIRFSEIVDNYEFSERDVKQILSATKLSINKKYFNKTKNIQEIDLVINEIIGTHNNYKLIKFSPFKKLVLEKITFDDKDKISKESSFKKTFYNFLNWEGNYKYLDKYISLLKKSDIDIEFMEEVFDKSDISFEHIPQDSLKKLIINKNGVGIKHINNEENVKKELYELLFEYLIFDLQKVFEEDENEYYKQIFETVFLETRNSSNLFREYNNLMFKNYKDKKLIAFLEENNYEYINDFMLKEYFWIVMEKYIKLAPIKNSFVIEIEKVENKRFIQNMFDITSYLTDIPVLFVTKNNFNLMNFEQNSNNENLYLYFDRFTKIVFEKDKNISFIKDIKKINFDYLQLILILLFTIIGFLLPLMLWVKYMFVSDISNKYTLESVLNEISMNNNRKKRGR